MTQITIRNVELDLADKIKDQAKANGESMNALILRMLRRNFAASSSEDPSAVPRNNLSKYRGGWFEDPETDKILAAFGEIDHDAWK